MDSVTEFRIELGRRIAGAVEKFPTKSAASKVAGVTLEQLNKWIAGEVKVPVDALWRLALEGDVDFCWLCTGRPAGQPGVAALRPAGRIIQESALRDVLMSLAEVIAADGVTFKPDRFADLAFALHDHLVNSRAQDGASADLAGLANVIRIAARS